MWEKGLQLCTNGKSSTTTSGDSTNSSGLIATNILASTYRITIRGYCCTTCGLESPSNGNIIG